MDLNITKEEIKIEDSESKEPTKEENDRRAIKVSSIFRPFYSCAKCGKHFYVGMRRDMLPPEDSLYTPAVDDFSRRRRARRRKVHAKLEQRSDSGSGSLHSESDVLKIDLKPAKILNTGSNERIDDVCEDINLGHDNISNPYDTAILDSTVDNCSFSVEDQKRIDELDAASTVFFAPHPHKSESSTMLGCPQSHIREKLQRCIEFSKRLSAFQQLNEHDQIALIKGGAWEMVLLRSLLNYNPETEQFGPNKFGDFYEYSKNCILRGRTLSNQLCNRFLSTLDPAWCDDKILVLLLIACCLFTSTRNDITNVPLVKYYEDVYKNSLYKYLLQQYRPSRARAKYQYNICQQKLDDLLALNQAKMQFLQTLAAQSGNTAPVDPLLSEIFGL